MLRRRESARAEGHEAETFEGGRPAALKETHRMRGADYAETAKLDVASVALVPFLVV
jgi:hypothetical protein